MLKTLFRPGGPPLEFLMQVLTIYPFSHYLILVLVGSVTGKSLIVTPLSLTMLSNSVKCPLDPGS